MKKVFFYLFLSLFLWGRSQSDTLVLMFTGDIMVHSPQIHSAFNPEDGTYVFDESFVFLKKIFRHADFVIGNLETTLGTKPYTGYPRFSAPPSLATALKKAGFTHLVTANNHSVDKGSDGIIRTIHFLDKYGLGHTGTYVSTGERQRKPFMMLKKNGFKIALLNYTYGTNGIPVPSQTPVNIIDTVLIKKDLDLAKKQSPDEIIVFLHWGNQYQSRPSLQQKEIEDFLHEHGVRIIIGSHPHVIQPIARKNNSVTVYSLGNFISNQRTFPRDGAFIFSMRLTKKDNQIKIDETGYIPTWVYKYKSGPKWIFKILPVDEFIIEKSYFENPVDFKNFLRFHRYIYRFMKKNAAGVVRKTDFITFPPSPLRPVCNFRLPPLQIPLKSIR